MTKHSRPLLSRKNALWTVAIVATATLVVGGIALCLRQSAPPAANTSSLPTAVTTAATTATTTTLPPTTTTTTTTTVAPTTTTTAQVIFKNLTFSTPTKTVFTTSESSIAFAGSTDPRATLTLNGKAVTLSAIGGFSVDCPLKQGINTFTFKDSNKTVTYKITYALDLIQSVTPNKPLTVEGGGSIQFRATAHKKATLTAAFNGKTLTMTPTVTPDGEASLDGGDYIEYQATFTLPKGTVDKTTALGAATVTARYNGLTEAVKSGAVTLKAVTVPRYITVTRDYAETFTGSVVNDYSRPDAAYLPAGTVDTIVKTGSAAGNTYYLLGCGRWIYTSDVEITADVKGVPKTALTVGKTAVSEEATKLAFNADWKIPYNLLIAPQTYRAPAANVPSYAVTENTAEYVDMTFYYVKNTPATPDVSDSPLFSAAAWRQEGGNPVLRLTLREKGQFYGYSVQWVNNTLLFSFKHPTSTADNNADKPLSGVRLVLDAGHGGESSGTYGTIKGYYEKTATLEYSLLLQKKLEALGATVVMTRTDDTLPDNPTMSTRTAYARNNGTDLLLSIHMNGSKVASANGCTLHYFNEYSYDIAKRLTATMRAVETAHGIGNRSEVTVWSPFFMARVHDCPAVLVECGFMTNADNMQKLVDAAYKEQLTDAIVKAVTDYFAALPQFEVTTTTTTTATTTTDTTDTATSANETTTITTSTSATTTATTPTV